MANWSPSRPTSRHLWRDDLVTFVIGCSFSFEQALIDAGLPLRHVEQGQNVAMFRTNLQTAPAGPFNGPLVVTMRPLRPTTPSAPCRSPRAFPTCMARRCTSATRRRSASPTSRDPTTATPSSSCPASCRCSGPAASRLRLPSSQARPEFCITHAPGAMLITDLLNQQLASF